MENMDTPNMENEQSVEESQTQFEVELEALENILENDDEFTLELEPFEQKDQEDKLWKMRTGLDEDSLCGAIETIIFMSDKPVALQNLRKMIDEEMPLRVLHASINRLQEEYENKHHGIRLMEVAEGYQFRTKATFSKYVQDLFKVNSLVLSPTALEVLAIIAYKQPVSRADVDRIRGVDSSHIVRSLIDKRLVKVTGRSEDMGRPVVYGTTPEFLEVFNLNDLTQLPTETELEDLAGQNELGKISEIQTICSGDKEKFKFDELEELDVLSSQIKNISADTPFVQSLKVEEKKRTTESNEEVKSAFDLLEEFVEKDKIIKENMLAAESALFAVPDEITIIRNLTEGPFNKPVVDDFEMIDLNTGEAVAEDEFSIEEIVEETYDSISSDDNLFDGDELNSSLDAAFEKIEKSDNQEIKSDLEIDESDLSLKEVDIDNLTKQMLSQADALDIDLSFLDNENSEE